MTSDELQELINNICSEVQYDLASGVTKYKLPQNAQTDDVIEALENYFEHYKSATVINGFLILEHPETDQ